MNEWEQRAKMITEVPKSGDLLLTRSKTRRDFAMSLTELRPAVKALPRRDRFLLVQELIAELAREEGVPAVEYPVWSPHGAYAAAASLLQILEQDKAKRT